jgi:glucosamine-6-phosphate deaminase
MRVVVFPTAAKAASAAADIVAQVLGDRRHPVLALPTGQTALPFYESLVALHKSGRADFARTTTFNLDEFVGLDRRDSRSYRAFMQRHLFDRVNLPGRRAHLFDGAASNPSAAAARFERQIARAGGFDLAVLGLGRNGHLALNEPARALHARSHLARLRPETRRANAIEFEGRWRDVPTHALTMGMATMLNARSIVLLALGAHKAAVVARALTGPVSTLCPASLLQLHPDVTVCCDRDAAAKLPRSFRPAGRTATS